MNRAFIVTTFLSLAAPASAAEQGSAASQPAPASAADSVVAAAFKDTIDTAKAGVQGAAAVSAPTPPPEPSFSTFFVPGLAIAGLAVFAYVATRRKRQGARSIRVLETASLGPKRDLVIAEVLGERLVLGVSEAGITVLVTKPMTSAEALAESGAPVGTSDGAGPLGYGEVAGGPEVPPRLRPANPPAMGFFERLRGRSGNPNFEAALNESIEDQELRAKLAAGFRGVAP